MKINFDAEPICVGQLTGIGMVERELCRRIVENHPEDEYLYTFFSMRGTKEKKQVMSEYCRKNSKIKVFPLLSSGIYKIISGIIPLPYRMFFGGKSDITHFFNFIIPPGVKGKKVCTIHDLAFKRYPETVNLKTRKYLEYRLKSTIKRADHIVVVSEFTASELCELYGVPREKMTVIYNGVDFDLYGKEPDKEKAEKILTEKGLYGQKYFFYLGTIEPRKNIKRLVGAYSVCVKRLKAEGKEVPKLVLGGKLGWYYDEILERIKQEEIEDNIKLIGYVSDEEKPILYRNALAFTFPSLYEGFGIPVIEAMACGTPVLTSNSTSLVEIAEESAVLCDPLSEQSIERGLYRLATEDKLREKLSSDGQAQARKFTWEDAAEKLYGVYQSLVDRYEK